VIGDWGRGEGGILNVEFWILNEEENEEASS
jgi:hypothetical protein